VPARSLRLLPLAAAAVVAACTAPRPEDDAAQATCTPRASAVHEARVAAALRSGRDRWGEQLIASRNGPTYTVAVRRVQPLLFARAPQGRSLTGSGVYYLPLAMPRDDHGARGAFLHVADGSEILARRWTGPSIAISVGPEGGERYGSCLARLTPARLANGWLPILQTGYRDAARGTYTQESFTARVNGRLAGFVRLTASAPASVELRVGSLSIAVPRGATRTLHVRWSPPGQPTEVDTASYATARASVGAYWRERLAEGVQLELPEARVENAARALLVQALVHASRYSYGNPYEQFSFPETVDMARVVAEYGFHDLSREMLRAALPARPRPYPNWKRGEKLLGFASYHELYRDRATLLRATPTLRRFLAILEQELQPNGLLPRERYSSDIAEQVYGLHAQATVWQGLREIARAWSRTGQRELAVRARRLAARLGNGLRRAIRSSQRPLEDGSLFVPMRLLDGVAPYEMVTESREASYWNLVAPYALASGIFPPSSREARGVLRYLRLHGARFLGLVRSAVFVLYGADSDVATTGVNPVYGNNESRFLAAMDEPDRLTLSLYGQLAAGMTRNTFVGGEGTSVAPVDGAHFRTTYLPPNAAANSTFLETLRLLLVHERANALELAFATPRTWLAAGRRISVRGFPTHFGPVSFAIDAGASSLRVRVEVPSRTPPGRLRLRLRLPAGQRIGRVTPPRPVDARTQTIDLSGLRGIVELEVGRSR